MFAEETVGKSNWFMQSYSQLIVLVAFVLRILLIGLRSLESFKEQTELARAIILPLFYLSMIIYALVPVLATWDLRGIGGIFEEMTDSAIINGIYNDFNSNWFLEVGQSIISTMTLNIFMPAIEFGLLWLIRYL